MCKGHPRPIQDDPLLAFMREIPAKIFVSEAFNSGAKTKRSVVANSNSNSSATQDGKGNVSVLVLQHLFSKYGHGSHLTLEGFKQLLESLGLARLAIDDHSVIDHALHRDYNHSVMQLHEHHPEQGSLPEDIANQASVAHLVEAGDKRLNVETNETVARDVSTDKRLAENLNTEGSLTEIQIDDIVSKVGEISS